MPAVPEETEKLFGIGRRRAAKLARWAEIALASVFLSSAVTARARLIWLASHAKRFR